MHQGTKPAQSYVVFYTLGRSSVQCPAVPESTGFRAPCCAVLLLHLDAMSFLLPSYYFFLISIPKPPWLHNSQNQQHTLNLRTPVQDGPGWGHVAEAHTSVEQSSRHAHPVCLYSFSFAPVGSILSQLSFTELFLC